MEVLPSIDYDLVIEVCLNIGLSASWLISFRQEIGLRASRVGSREVRACDGCVELVVALECICLRHSFQGHPRVEDSATRAHPATSVLYETAQALLMQKLCLVLAVHICRIVSIGLISHTVYQELCQELVDHAMSEFCDLTLRAAHCLLVQHSYGHQHLHIVFSVTLLGAASS